MFAELQSPADRPLTTDDRALVDACRTPLLDLGDRDVRAAGFGAQPNPLLSFGDTPATVTHTGTDSIVRGLLTFKMNDAPLIPVQFECRLQRASRTVQSVTYGALDADGTPIARRPVDLVKEHRILRVCAARIESQMDTEANKAGDRTPLSAAELLHASTTFSTRNGTVDLEGRGRARYGNNYEWQDLRFRCRYDEKKADADRTTHMLSAATAPMTRTLQADPRAAVSQCQGLVRNDIIEDARRTRGYPWTRRFEIELPESATVAVNGNAISVTGRGEVRLDPAHRRMSPISYACTYDTVQQRLTSGTFLYEDGGWTPSGARSTGPTETLVCETVDAGMRRSCAANIQRDVVVLREFGSRPCVEYQTWRWDSAGIHVSGGCQAEFQYVRR